MSRSQHDVSALLVDVRNGDRAALDRLLPLVYGELRHIAHRYMQRRFAGQTLQTTALVHEAYIRLAGNERNVWQDRSHFFAVCAQVMRNLLIDRARSRQAEKRGGRAHRVSLEKVTGASSDDPIDLLTLNEALDNLAAFDLRKSRIVEMRYFGGMTAEETAEVLDVSPITVKREWLKARAWLYKYVHTGCDLKN
jgi:RNA polymerase sigma-70 factor, ECF subfamily